MRAEYPKQLDYNVATPRFAYKFLMSMQIDWHKKIIEIKFRFINLKFEK